MALPERLAHLRCYPQAAAAELRQSFPRRPGGGGVQQPGAGHSVIPLGLHHIRFNFEIDPDTKHDGRLDRELAYGLLGEMYGLSPEDVDVYRQVVYAFEGKLARTWRVGRVFLAGDAAHLMTPFLGQGGCSALRDTINLAWKLDLVLRGIAGPQILETYQEERMPQVRDYIDQSDKVAAMIFVKDPAAAAERDQRLKASRDPQPTPDPALEIGVLHREVGGKFAPPVGTLAPQGVVFHGGREARLDDLLGWGFQLLGWKVDPARDLGDNQRQFLQRLGCPVAEISDVPTGGSAQDLTGAYQRFFAPHGIAALLVRPDFIVYGAAKRATEVPGLVDSLMRQLQPR